MKYLIYIIAVFCSLNIYAQDVPSPQNPPSSTFPPQNPHAPPKEFERFIDRLYFGGNVGAWFGSTTYINVQPLVGVRLTKKFSIGGGFTYNYFSQRYGGIKYESTIYGSNAFARYFILENLFAQVGWDHLSVPDFTSPIPDSRAWVENVLVGGGYCQPFSENGNFIIAVFYNVNQTPLSPYPNPIVQIGFNIGF